MPPPPEPTAPFAELTGATSEPIPLGQEPKEVEFEIDAPTGPARMRADGSLRKIYLHVCDITSSAPAPSFAVYLNVPRGRPPAEHPERLAGTLPMFGLLESSQRDERHPGNGLTYRLDVTGVVQRLIAEDDWDPRRLRVTFVARPWEGSLGLQIGQLRLYFA